MPPARAGSNGSRRYLSPARAAQAQRTRGQILVAARRQFLAVGYTASTMKAIAALGGVSVPTVELAFGTKSQLLKAVIDVAIAGDDEPVPILRREFATTAGAAATLGEFLTIFGEALRPAMERSAGLVLVAREAAATDAESAALSAQIDRERAGTVAWLVDGILHRAALRPGLDRDRAVDIVWMLLDPITYSRLTRDRGWTAADFVRWLTAAIPQLLLTDSPVAATPDAPGPEGSTPTRRKSRR